MTQLSKTQVKKNTEHPQSQMELLHTAYQAYNQYMSNAHESDDFDRLIKPLDKLDEIIAVEQPKSLRDFALKFSMEGDIVSLMGCGPIIESLVLDSKAVLEGSA